jgi:hypothetical protein
MLDRQKLENHIKHLQEQHDRLDREIKELYEHHTDDFKIEAMKKQKLNIRDDIERIKRQISGI